MKPSIIWTLLTLQLLTVQSASAELLQGSVEVQDKIEELSPKLRNGEQLTERAHAIPAENDWYPIPIWMTGVWQTIQVLQLSSIDQRTAEETSTPKAIAYSEQERFGFQLDSRKQSWTPGFSVDFKNLQDMNAKTTRTNSLIGTT